MNHKRRIIIATNLTELGLCVTPAVAVNFLKRNDAVPPCLSSPLRTLSEIELIHAALRELEHFNFYIIPLLSKTAKPWGMRH
jgi:hypothetical protein